MQDNIPILRHTVSEAEAVSLNPLVLAFVGDTVQQLYVRTKLALNSQKKAGELHKLAVLEVKAVAQAEIVEKLLPLFTEEETDIFKRARNTHYNTSAKNASIGEYKKASGFEAVLGYLYLTGKHERLETLLSVSADEESNSK